MGKKSKGGRRQILQIEDKKPNRSSSIHEAKYLIHYSDSDDDSKKSNDSEHSSAISNKEVCPLDTQVADFFKEINALTVNEDSNDTNESGGFAETELGKESTDTLTPEVSCEAKAKETMSENESDEKSGSYCPWQEIRDDSTGYSYYWNLDTNEVTWDCPTEYVAYMKSAKVKKENKDKNLKKSQKKKETHQKEDGSIIPISYFGESSSDESSSGDSAMRKFHPKRNKTEKVVFGNKSKTNKFSKIKSDHLEIIGPQLPPDFQFAQNIPLTAEESNSSSKNESSELSIVISQNIINGQSTVDKVAPVIYQPNLSTVLIGSTTCDNLGNECLSNKILSEMVIKTGEESPDSTVRQGDVLAKSAFGNRLVVEYDSFSDEDEEIVSSNISCKKKENCTNEAFGIVKNFSEDQEFNSRKIESLKETEKHSEIIIGAKRKDFIESNEELCEQFITGKAKKSKTYNFVDIDNMFATHSFNQKHGFGFKQESDFMDCPSCSKDSYSYRTASKKNDYKSVSFIKSDYILDLNELNCVNFSEESNQIVSEDAQPMSVFEGNNNEISSANINVEKTIQDSKNTVISSAVDKSADQESKTVISENTFEPHRSKNMLLDYEEDIDEIDKALCEALEAKKALEKELKVSTSRSHEKQMNECVLISMKEDKSCSDEDIPVQEIDKTDILALSSTLVDKLTFLVSNHSLASLNNLLVQLQTRLIDWQASALESKYFMDRLQEVNQYMCQYELGIVSGDWICQWDRQNKRYFYSNNKTQQSQWTYPEDLCNDEKSSCPQLSQSEISASPNSTLESEGEELPTVSSSIPEILVTKNTLQSIKNNESDYPLSPTSNWSFQSSPPPPPPGVDSPPPPPPCSPPPCSPPPPPPDTTDTVCDLSEDMDLENSNDSFIQPIISNSALYEANEIQYPTMFPCSSNKLMNNFVDTSIASVSSTLRTTREESNIISGSPQTFPINNSNTTLSTYIWSASQPSYNSDVLQDNSDSQIIAANAVCSQSSDSLLDPCHSSSNSKVSNSIISSNSMMMLPCTSDDISRTCNQVSSGAVLKKEKKKTKLLSVLALKKKNIPSLVEKWQKIRDEQEKEDNSDHS